VQCRDAAPVSAVQTTTCSSNQRADCSRSSPPIQRTWLAGGVSNDLSRAPRDRAPASSWVQAPRLTKAFAAKYPKAKLAAAEKQTHGAVAVTYELAFVAAGARKEATFTEAGKFVEEE